jgi:tRNA(Ile)-lysidine synthase
VAFFLVYYLCSVINRFQEYIEQHSLCAKNDRILLTVSGGVDSMVMLDLFVRTGYEVAVAHCNFHLRGDESDGDEQFVVNACAEYGVEVFVKHFDTKAYAKQNHVSVQVAARDLRYTWFEQLRQDKNFDFIAVAHHADDSVETFFINLLRGSGITGLKGISVRRENIIRPLLFAEREDIERYAHEHEIPYREDSSNKEDKYLRNKIRHQLLPRLKEMTDNYEQTVIASLNRLEEADGLLQQLLEEKFARLLIARGDMLVVQLEKLLELEPLDVWVYYLLRQYGFNRDTTDRITTAVKNKQTGSVFHAAAYNALVDRDYLLLKPVGEAETGVFLLEENTREIAEPIKMKIEASDLDDHFSLNRAEGVAQLDMDKLEFPLKIRKWQEGDRFVPLGMSGTKLVSDYFIDNKISRFDKERIWLLLSGNDIVWIIGHRISDKYKISSGTKRVLTITT